MNMVGLTTNAYPNNSANLETCPFCGHKAVLDKAYAVTRSTATGLVYEARFRYRCGNGWCGVAPATGWRESESEARGAWNSRA